MADLGTGEILGAGAFIVVILRTILDFIGPRMKKNGNGNGAKSGDQDPAYWREAFRSIISEEIEDAFKRRGW